MANKKIFYFSLLLFINAYLFILFDRLSHGLPARFFISLILTALILGASLLGIIRSVSLIKNETLSQKDIFRKKLFLSTILGGISGLIFWFITSHPYLPNNLGFFLFAPLSILLTIILFMILPKLIVLLVSWLIRKWKISFAIIVLAVPLILLIILNIILLHNCTADGCKNIDSLAEKALRLDDPKVCDERQSTINFKLLENPQFGAFNDPMLISDPLPTEPEEDISSHYIKNKCLAVYTQNRTTPTENIKLCLSTGFEQDKCIERIIKAYPLAAKCEELKGLKGKKDYLDELDPIDSRENAYSSCYKALALKTNKEEYCKKISHPHFINACYAELANKRNDERLCYNIITDGDLENPKLEFYVSGVKPYETKEECAKWVRKEGEYRQPYSY